MEERLQHALAKLGVSHPVTACITEEMFELESFHGKLVTMTGRPLNLTARLHVWAVRKGIKAATSDRGRN